jgi:hypothetical protein
MHITHPEVVSTEQNEVVKKPLLQAHLFDVSKYGDGEEEKAKNDLNALINERKMAKPLVVMEIFRFGDIELKVDGKVLATTEKERLGKAPLAKLICSVYDLVVLRNINQVEGHGDAMAEANSQVPVSVIFKAANIMLQQHGVACRAMPFPIMHSKDDAHKGQIGYQMLIVDPEEYNIYQTLLQKIAVKHGYQKAMEDASKYSYEILRKRAGGANEIPANIVERSIVHFTTHDRYTLNGVLLRNAEPDFFEDLAERFQIFY